LADMPSRLEGGDSGQITLSGVANNPVEVRVLLLQQFFTRFTLWGDGTWQTCPLVSGVGVRDKRGVMPV